MAPYVAEGEKLLVATCSCGKKHEIPVTGKGETASGLLEALQRVTRVRRLYEMPSRETSEHIMELRRLLREFQSEVVN